jgi:hypothetical protein
VVGFLVAGMILIVEVATGAELSIFLLVWGFLICFVKRFGMKIVNLYAFVCSMPCRCS